MDTSLASVTVNVWSLLLIPSLVAFICVEPKDADVAKPVALMLATKVLLDNHVTVSVMSFVLQSE